MRPGVYGRARTSNVCAARPMRPCSSQRAVSVMPMPSTWVTASRQTHSPAGRAQQVHAEVGVDEDESAPVERCAHAVAAVGGHHHALKRGELLALHECHARAQPGRGGAGFQELPTREDDLHRGVPAHALARREELEGGGVLRPGRRLVLLPVGRDVGRGEAPGACPHHLAVGPGQRRLEHLHAAPGPDDAGAQRERGDRHGRQDLHRHAAHPHALTRLAALDRAAEQRRRRAGVLGVRVPGPAGELARRHLVAIERRRTRRSRAARL